MLSSLLKSMKLECESDKRFYQWILAKSTIPSHVGILMGSDWHNIYTTFHSVVELAAFTLSHEIFSYSPRSFGFSTDLREWTKLSTPNAYNCVPGYHELDIRCDAGTYILGYLTSSHYPSTSSDVSVSILSTNGLLDYFSQAVYEYLVSGQARFRPVFHISAIRYIGGESPFLYADYTSAFRVSNERNMCLISTYCKLDGPYVALLAMLLARCGYPVIHIYDGMEFAHRVAKYQINVLQANTIGQILQKFTHNITSTVNSSASTLTDTICHYFDVFNAITNKAFAPFEYFGSELAGRILIVFGAAECHFGKHLVELAEQAGDKLGLVVVRLFRPFAKQKFLQMITSSVRFIYVLGQVAHESLSDEYVNSSLFESVMSTFFEKPLMETRPIFYDIKYDDISLVQGSLYTRIFDKDLAIEAPITRGSELLYLQSVCRSGDKRQKMFQIMGDILRNINAVDCTSSSIGNAVLQGGLVETKLAISHTDGNTFETDFHDEEVFDFVHVSDIGILKSLDLVKCMKEGSILLAGSSLDKSTDALEKCIPAAVRKVMWQRKIKLSLLKAGMDDVSETTMKMAILFILKNIIPELYTVVMAWWQDGNDNEDLDCLIGEVIANFPIPDSWSNGEVQQEMVMDNAKTLPWKIPINQFMASLSNENGDGNITSEERIYGADLIAKRLCFKEAYQVKLLIRPDLNIVTHVVKLIKRKRLTPINYDRNIFHLEFDLEGTQVSYDIGEALGIHATNDQDKVEEFIKWYGLDGDEVILKPLSDNECSGNSNIECEVANTMRQSLIRIIDIFGKPRKHFYEDLASFATDETEKKKLLFIASKQGASELKKRCEVEMLTFVDVLEEFSSARPSFQDLAKMVGPIKRREYSIASSQKVDGQRLSLLVVEVTWTDSKGRLRNGQATNYLNTIAIGTPVIISVKPSLMKLPPDPKTPIVMAGLGTGLAPFRAFVQERALQKAQGIHIGSVLLFMGSRHQREEYLFGEEWEAYREAGVITTLGCAFSRDQPQKIYIQDRMRQSIQTIQQVMLHENGYFYLCGPTWPVPDVSRVLQEAIELDTPKNAKVDSALAVEQLKEAGRYVLEVY